MYVLYPCFTIKKKLQGMWFTYWLLIIIWILYWDVSIMTRFPLICLFVSLHAYILSHETNQVLNRDFIHYTSYIDKQEKLLKTFSSENEDYWDTSPQSAADHHFWSIFVKEACYCFFVAFQFLYLYSNLRLM